MRYLRFIMSIILIGLLSPGVSTSVHAQAARTGEQPAPAENKISAESAPYRIEWNGTSGTFIRSAFGQFLFF